MRHAGEAPQIELPIEVSVDVGEYPVHPRRIYGVSRDYGRPLIIR